MVNYFYNIILKTDSCDLYSDVLTSIRKDYYLSKEKQKGKITQNSSGDTIFYEFSIEKEKPLKWSVSDSKSIISDCKILTDGQSCVNFYGENGLYKSITFSKYQTLLKVEYFNMTKTTEPYCTIEPRKAGNGLCLLLSSRENIKPSVLYPMPYVDDDYILDKIELEFDEYTLVASTNEGVVKFLSESQLEVFEEFVDRAMALKLTDTAPESFIEEDDAVLAQKLNPKDFNVKRNLSEIIDISQAQEFSYDNIEEELVSDLFISETDEDAEVAEEIETIDTSVKSDDTLCIDTVDTDNLDSTDIMSEVDVEDTESVPVFTEALTIDEVCDDTIDDEILPETSEQVVASEEAEITTISEAQDNFDVGEFTEPDRYIESASAKYLYFGELSDNRARSGFGRTATQEGRTAYEGYYSDNKRNGVGAYYYKDSSLCYYGNWKDNKREGFGIGISSFDKSVHVGKFCDNKSVGDGVRVDNDGNIKFVKKHLSNGCVVEISFEGDKIIVSKFNENGELLSENTSNLMYF